MSYLVLTDTGLVAGFGPKEEALTYHPGAKSVERVLLADTTHNVAAFGNLAAWSFNDGTVEVVDTVDGRHWTIHARVERSRASSCCRGNGS